MYLKIKNLVTRNILYKTLFFSGILGAIGLLVLGVFAYQITKDELRKISQENIRMINHDVLEHTKWKLNQKDVIGSVTSSKYSKEELISEIREFIHENNKEYFTAEEKSGYTYIMNGEGTLISHPKTEGNNISQRKFAQKILKNKAGELTYSWNGRKRYVAYDHMPELDWIVVTSCYVDEMVAPIKRIRNVMAFLGILAILVMGIGAIFLTRHITNPINELAAAMEQGQEGDLTPRVDFTDRKDELGRLGTNFNEMLDKIVSLLEDTVDTSSKVSRVSDKLSNISNEANELSEQASDTTEEMAQGADKQSEQLEDISEIMRQIAAITEETATQAEYAQDKSMNTLEKAKRGNQAVKKVINKMRRIQNTVDNSADVIYKLGEKSEKIGEIIEIISNIAKQTDLLALNAAIEAARAGEHGQGFRVVADEVRKLAEESQESAEKVAEIITEIQAETNEAVEAIQAGTQEVTEGEQLADNAGEALRNIKSFMEDTAAMIEDISSGAEEQSANTQQVTASVEDVASVSQQTAAGAQQNLALIQEQGEVVGEVSNLASSLNCKVKELNSKINRFNLEKSTTEANDESFE